MCISSHWQLLWNVTSNTLSSGDVQSSPSKLCHPVLGCPMPSHMPYILITLWHNEQGHPSWSCPPPSCLDLNSLPGHPHLSPDSHPSPPLIMAQALYSRPGEILFALLRPSPTPSLLPKMHACFSLHKRLTVLAKERREKRKRKSLALFKEFPKSSFSIYWISPFSFTSYSEGRG